jgi:prophage antirepressor-like protein
MSTHNFSGYKEKYNRMSLVHYTFNNTNLFTVDINGKQWTRAKEVCESLEYEKESRKVIKYHISSENIRHKHELQVGPESDPTCKWPLDSQKLDLYINEQGMYELAFKSQQPKAKTFRKYCYNKLFPQIIIIIIIIIMDV